MEGFFTRKETESISRPGGKTFSCVSCGLYKQCNSPRMKPFGNFKKGILNIGSVPDETDDKFGNPWQGKSGKLLERMYKKLGIDLFEDCLNTNAINCYSEKEPTNHNIDCCRKRILHVIEEYKPKVIVLFGMEAVTSLIGHRWKKDLGGINKWRGWTIPDQDFKTWICPTFHPSYIEESENGAEEVIWKQDLNIATLLHLDKFPLYKEPRIEFICDLKVLKNIKDTFAFDYETTGIKPHAAGHRIVSVAIADSADHCYTFFLPNTKQERQPLIDLLEDESIGKIAQNMKFEDTWTKVRLRATVKNWLWDTMLATHLLDNRPGVTGLKFQTYVQFGIVDYASEISPYLESNNKNANALNRIFELLELPGGREKLLRYGGLDAIFEYRLAMLQRNEIVLPF